MCAHNTTSARAGRLNSVCVVIYLLSRHAYSEDLITRGIEDVFVCSQSVDGELFQQFLCQCVLPIILPFDGNNPRSIVVMDNASIHHL